jgi:hypothetical protein
MNIITSKSIEAVEIFHSSFERSWFVHDADGFIHQISESEILVMTNDFSMMNPSGIIPDPSWYISSGSLPPGWATAKLSDSQVTKLPLPEAEDDTEPHLKRRIKRGGYTPQ